LANLIETAEADGRLGTLLKVIRAAGIEKMLSAAGPFTLLAPTDGAFEKLPPGTVDRLLERPGELKEILAYHIVNARLPAETIAKAAAVQTLHGRDVAVKVQDDCIVVEHAKVVQADIQADNGLCHIIDAVLMP